MRQIAAAGRVVTAGSTVRADDYEAAGPVHQLGPSVRYHGAVTTPRGSMPRLYTTAALVAFAANSLLCRLALAGDTIDAASFTGIRLLSGACVLTLLSWKRPQRQGALGSFASAFALFSYAAAFSYAYLRLGAGMGALILFGCVQATMIGAGIVRGERPGPATWAGVLLALLGLLRLALPFTSKGDALGAGMMALAGIAWGIYSLRGRRASADPLHATAGNFVRSLPFALVLWLAATTTSMADAFPPHVSVQGVLLAIASGALASGIGYSLWYTALPQLSATQAGVVQLLVPILAAWGGVMLLDEEITIRLLSGGTAVLGGVALALHGNNRS